MPWNGITSIRTLVRYFKTLIGNRSASHPLILLNAGLFRLFVRPIGAGHRYLGVDANGDVAVDSSVDAYIADFRDKVDTSMTELSGPASLRIVNQPNPFSDGTSVTFTLPATSPMDLTVYDALGIKVEHLIHEHLRNGMHHRAIDASKWRNGIYYFHLLTESGNAVMKMIRMK